MNLTSEAVLQLAAQCAPQAAAETLLAVARAESGLDPLAIGVNGPLPHRLRVPSREAAIEATTALIARGGNVDLGLAQINSRNLEHLNLSVADAFDPCRSLAAGATLLESSYRTVRTHAPDDQTALRIALSVYNTGDRARGFRNGYVARVERSAARGPNPPGAPQASTPLAPPTSPWDVFGDLGPSTFITTPALRQGDARCPCMP